MSKWNLELEQQEIVFGDTTVSLYMIRTDHTARGRELVHCHSYYEIHVILRGVYDYSVADRKITVRAGEMLIIPPEVSHKVVISQPGLEYCALPLAVKKRREGDAVYSAVTRSLNENACMPLRLGQALLGKISDYHKRVWNQGVRSLLHKKLEACEIVVGILDQLDCGSDGQYNSTPVDYTVMLETMVENSTVPLSEIARRLGYSERQTSRKIKEHYGKTFSEVRRSMR